MAKDWTAHRGRANSSNEFKRCVALVDEIICGSGHALIHGQTESVARLIVAQLAHVRGLAPRGAG